jgi:hypothetical protein
VIGNDWKTGAGKRSWHFGAEWLTPSQNWTACVNVLLQKTLADAVVFLDREQIPYALIGGLAASLRGEPRVTGDVDLVIQADVDRVLELADQLDGTTFKPLFSDIADVIRRSFILPLRHRATNIKVDLSLGLSGFEQQTIVRATPVEVAGSIVAVATAEDLLILKVLAGRAQDEEDIRGIITAHGNALDWAYCLNTAAELGHAIGQDLVGAIRALRREQQSENLED